MREAWERGAFDRVATLAFERYGPELLGVLAARLRSHTDAAEVFSMFAEDLWRGLPGFQWRCSLRAWAHRLARNAAVRYATRDARPRRNIPLSQAPEVWELVDRVRTTTLVYLRTEVKSELRQLREALSDDDQTLLILRVDKDMDWRDIAAAMADDDLDDAALGREAARLRKRFQLAKERLRQLAQERGLLP